MPALTTEASRPRRGQARQGADVDVVVIGAGFAGLVAARELGRAGFGVLVLEARRPGRRAYLDRPQARPRPGARRHLGALGQPHTWAEMTRTREITPAPRPGKRTGSVQAAPRARARRRSS